MLILLSNDTIDQYVATYRSYIAEKGHLGLGDRMPMCNGELEVDPYLASNLHLVWYGYFYSLFPRQWSLIPEKPALGTQTISLTEKAKVRYICQHCSHTWTSLNGTVKFWAAANHIVYFHLRGTQCSQCQAMHQPATWYPDEVVRVLNNLYGFLNNGKEGRMVVARAVTYQRGVTRPAASADSSVDHTETFSDVSSEISTVKDVSNSYMKMLSLHVPDVAGKGPRSESVCSVDSGVDLLSCSHFSNVRDP